MTVKDAEFYRKKLILAPMVRCNSLPFRMLARECGATLIYSEELIDYSLLKCKILKNSLLGTVDFLQPNGTIVLSVLPEEKDDLIVQIGSSDAKRAAKCCALVRPYCRGVDLNMGCPKSFSLSGGMGAALISNVDNAVAILSEMAKETCKGFSISCKIRIHSNWDETFEMIERLRLTGISALTIHGRTKVQRHHDENSYSFITKAFSLIKQLPDDEQVACILNGASNDIAKLSDVLKLKDEVGADSIMVARAAQENPSVFNEEQKPTWDILKRFLELSMSYDNNIGNMKYNGLHILGKEQETELGVSFRNCDTVDDVATLFDMKELRRRREFKDNEVLHDPYSITIGASRLDGDSGDDVLVMDMKVEKTRKLRRASSARAFLHEFCARHKISLPVYETESVRCNEDSVHGCIYRMTVRFVKDELSDKLVKLLDGRSSFTTAECYTSKKLAGQAVAMGILLHILRLDLDEWSAKFGRDFESIGKQLRAL